MFASIVTISGGRPHWYGEICCCSYVVVVVTPGGLPAWYGGFKGNMTYIIVVTFGGLPACYGRRCCCRCCKLLLSFLANVSRSGSIVVVGDPIFENVLGFGVVCCFRGPVAGRVLYRGEGPKMGQSDQIT